MGSRLRNILVTGFEFIEFEYSIIGQPTLGLIHRWIINFLTMAMSLDKDLICTDLIARGGK
jgi:hypothetical protein